MNKTKLSTTFKCLSALAFVSLTPCAQAQLTLDLGGGTNATSVSSTFGDLNTATPTSTLGAVTTSGPLSGASGSFDITAGAAADFNSTAWTLTGTTLSIDTPADVVLNSAGWGAVSGAIGNFSKGQLVAFTFDLGSLTLGAGQSLQLDSFTTDVAVNDIGFINSGVSTTGLNSAGGTTAVIVNAPIVDGSTFGFAGSTLSFDGSGSNSSASFRISSLNISVVPEPSSFSLIAAGLALSAVMLRRRV